MKKRILSLLLVLCLSVTVIFVTANPAEAAVDKDFYYGRNALKALPNSEALLYAYDQIVEGVENTAEQIDVYDGKHNLSQEELKLVFAHAYRYDYAHHFWLGTGYNVSSNTKTVLYIRPQYLFQGEALTVAKQKFEAEVSEILAGIQPSMSDYEKELYIHDTLAKRITYVGGRTHSHNAYGALVEDKCVCEGYAESLQYLLHRVGIQSYIAAGHSKGEGHAWNFVKIDGKWYQTDLTWNDQGEITYHNYFNIPTSVMDDDHTLESTQIQLPVCNSDDAFYFKNKPNNLGSNYNVATVAKVLKRDNYVSHFYVDNVTNFWSWIQNNINAIVQQMNVNGSGATYGINYIGREAVVHIEGLPTCNHNWQAATCGSPRTCSKCGAEDTVFQPHSWQAATCDAPKTCKLCGATEGQPLGHSWVDATETTPKTCSVCGKTDGEPVHTHSLTAVASVESTCTQNGKKAHFSCQCGKLFWDANATQEITDPAQTVIPALTHTWVEATCTAPKTCSTCGATEGTALGHTWVDATETTPKTCSVCGKTDGAPVHTHTWLSATCTDPKTCSACGATEGTALGHTWVDATETTPKTCSVCGKTDGAPVHTHTWLSATCTEPKTCSSCGATEGEALGHLLTKVEAVAPTADKAGNIAYYICDDCAGWYLDEAGTQPITDKNSVVVAPAVTADAVWVGGVALTSGQYLESGSKTPVDKKPSGSGYAYYKDGVLTLNSAAFFAPGYCFNESKQTYATIYAPGSLKIVLVGVSTIGMDTDNSVGIAVEDTLEITGDGDLGVSAPGCAIYQGSETGQVRIDSGSMRFSGKYGVYTLGDIVIEGGHIITDTDFAGLDSGKNLTIRGGKLDMTMKVFDEEYIHGALEASGNLTITGGTIQINAQDFGAVAFGDVNISGGEIQMEAYAGIQSLEDSVDITGGNLQIVAVEFGLKGEKAVRISGGIVNADCQYFGIQAPQVEVTGGELIATSTETDADEEACAIDTKQLTVGNDMLLRVSLTPDGSKVVEYDPASRAQYDQVYITASPKGCDHKLTKIPNRDATCTEEGNFVYFICDLCGQWYTDEEGIHLITDKTSVVIAPLGHSVVKVEAVEPGCVTGGNKSHYTCQICAALYWDAEGKDLITDPNAVVLSYTGHTPENTYQQDANNHWVNCAACGQQIPDSVAAHTGDPCDVCGHKTEKPADPPADTTWGDANGDGKINAKDAMLVLQFYTKKITEDKLSTAMSDVDGNGKLNAKDAMLILQFYTKKIENFPAQPQKPEHSELYLEGVSVEDAIRYFAEVCLDTEYGGGSGANLVRKWTEPVYYRLNGNPTQKDLEVLTGFVAYLNSVPGFPGIQEAGHNKTPNLQIHFCDEDEMVDIVGTNAYNCDGYVTFWYNGNYEIIDEIICYLNTVEQHTRNSVILEEIYNGAGPVQDTILREDSIAYQYFSTPQNLSPEDELILKLLYHPDMKCGMDYDQAAAVIRSIYY